MNVKKWMADISEVCECICPNVLFNNTFFCPYALFNCTFLLVAVPMCLFKPLFVIAVVSRRQFSVCLLIGIHRFRPKYSTLTSSIRLKCK